MNQAHIRLNTRAIANIQRCRLLLIRTTLIAIGASGLIALVAFLPSANAAPVDDVPVIPNFYSNDPVLTPEANNDIRTVQALYWKIRYAQDIYGKPTTVSNLDVQLLRATIIEDSIDLDARRWAIASGSDIYVHSPHITSAQRATLAKAILHVWQHGSDETARHVAHLVLTEEMSI